MAKIEASKKTVETWIGLVVLAIVAGVAWYLMQAYAPKADGLLHSSKNQVQCETALINGRCPGVYNGAYDKLYVKVSANPDCHDAATSCPAKMPRYFGLDLGLRKFELKTLDPTMLATLQVFAQQKLCAKVSGIEDPERYYQDTYKAVQVSGVDSGGNACGSGSKGY